jgi:hypothetical protein
MQITWISPQNHKDASMQVQYFTWIWCDNMGGKLGIMSSSRIFGVNNVIFIFNDTLNKWLIFILCFFKKNIKSQTLNMTYCNYIFEVNQLCIVLS